MVIWSFWMKICYKCDLFKTLDYIKYILISNKCIIFTVSPFKYSGNAKTQKYILLHTVTGRFAHFPVRHESFRPESFRTRVVSPSITWIISPSYPESFRPLFGESFRPLSKFIFYWGYCDKFTVFVSFNEDFGYISFKNDMSFINWSKWYIYLYSV